MESFFDNATLTILNRAVEFIVIATAAAGLIAYFMKEYNVASAIKKIFGVLFIAAAVINAIYFVISFFLADFRLYNLTQALIFFVIGSALVRWKLPMKE